MTGTADAADQNGQLDVVLALRDAGLLVGSSDSGSEDAVNTYLLTWNPARFHWDGLAEEVRQLRREGFLDGEWSCGRRKHVEPGDRVFLIRQGVEPRGIVASGHALTSPEPGEITFDKKRLGAMTNYIDVRFDAPLDPDIDGVLPRTALDRGALAHVNWGTQGGGIAIKAEAAELLEDLWAEHLAGLEAVPAGVIAEEIAAPSRYVEGATTRISVNAYERNPAAREACIQRHGLRCACAASTSRMSTETSGRASFTCITLSPLLTWAGNTWWTLTSTSAPCVPTATPCSTATRRSYPLTNSRRRSPLADRERLIRFWCGNLRTWSGGTMSARYGLSKSRYQTGLNCRKALWLAVHEPDVADPVSEGQQARFEAGDVVGELARDRFPGGVLVEEGHTEQRAALARTRELIEQGVPVLYEAAFVHDERARQGRCDASGR